MTLFGIFSSSSAGNGQETQFNPLVDRSDLFVPDILYIAYKGKWCEWRRVGRFCARDLYSWRRQPSEIFGATHTLNMQPPSWRIRSRPYEYVIARTCVCRHHSLLAHDLFNVLWKHIRRRREETISIIYRLCALRVIKAPPTPIICPASGNETLNPLIPRTQTRLMQISQAQNWILIPHTSTELYFYLVSQAQSFWILSYN